MTGKNKLLRVTQMNAVYLDNEIYKSFLHIVRDSFKFLPPGFTAPYDNEINLAVRLAVLYYSIIKSGSTFGQQLLSIKYNDMSTIKKFFYLIANCSEYMEYKFNISERYFKLYAAVKLLDFLNMSIFLQNGVKPLLIERILGINQVYATENSVRHFESKYLARELLWNGFIEFFLHIVPLINYHKLKRTIRNHNPFHVKPIVTSVNKQRMTMHTKCAHCNESPVLPHHMGCEHIFCYVCLKGNQTADPKYECPICEQSNPFQICEKVNLL